MLLIMTDLNCHFLSAPSRRLLLGGLLGLLVAVSGTPRLANGQASSEPGIIDRYLTARFLAQARQVLTTHGSAVPVMAPVRLATTADSLLPPPPDTAGLNDEPTFDITERRVVRRLERTWFQDEFGDTPWAFLGNSSYLTSLDTTFTRTLRARLEAQFGPPTRTLAELLDEDGSIDDYVQFEYWFVVNDSIPAVVMDVHGPYDRGLIVATDRRYREELRAFRKALLAPLVESPARKPFVDYFYDVDVERWYRTGYDGADYFIEPVPRGRIVPGRRPWIEPVRAAEAASEDPSANQSSQ
jgi:hypothetical protein